MKKTHIAMINIPAYGHINPTLALMSELVKQDYRVTYPVTEEFIPAVKATGASDLLFHSSWKEMQQEAVYDIFKNNVKDLPLKMLNEAISSYYELQELYRNDLPDFILYDFVAIGGKLFAAKHGIPAARLCSSYAKLDPKVMMFDFPEETVQELTSKMQEFLEKEELSGLSLGELSMGGFMEPEQLNIAYMPRAFQPEGDKFDERYHFIGPSIGKRNYQESLPLDDSRPVMLISLGTIFNPWPEFYKMCMEAFGGSEWQVVMSIGSHLTPESLGEIPDNFIVRQKVPQLEILPQAKLFITHGGMNSTMEALNFGVPMVVVPQMIEQEVTARRVSELALGQHFLRDEVTVEGLRTAVREVAEDEQLKQRVLGMQKHIQEAGGAAKGAEIISDYLNKIGKETAHSAR